MKIKNLQLVVFSFFLTISSLSYGQICTINYSANTPGAYPATLPNATAHQVYSADLTLLFPQQNTSSINYTSFKITSVELPLGLTWEWNQGGSSNQFDPQTDPYTCMKISGTPVNDGSYTVAIKTEATLANNTTSSYTFYSNLVVDASASSNTLFTMSPAVGCETVTVSFNLNNPVNYTPIPGLTTGIQHKWIFGNGNQSSSATPTDQTYTGAGDYHVIYTQTIDTTGFILKEISVTNVGATDAVGYGEPDLYIQVMDGSNNMVYNTENSPDDASLPQTYSMNILLDNPPYTIRVMDDDSGNAWGKDDDNAIDGDENNATTSLYLPSANSFGVTNMAGGQGLLVFNYKVKKDTTQVTADATVHVYSNPQKPILSVDSVSSPTTISTQDMGYVYHWFLNDTTRLFSAKGTTIVPDQYGDGNFSVMAVDEHGCVASSDDKTVKKPDDKGDAGVMVWKQTHFSIYPNPSEYIANVRLYGAVEGAHIVLSDIMGRTLMQRPIAGNQTVTLNVSGLANGIYTVSLVGPQGRTRTKKIIIQH